MADKTGSHFQAVLQGGQSMRDCPGPFLQNFDRLSSSPLLSPAWEGGTSETEMKMLPKDFIHIQTFMHLTKAGKRRGAWRGCNLLFKHSLSDWITCGEIRVQNKALMVPLPWQRRAGARPVSDEILLVCPALWTGCSREKPLWEHTPLWIWLLCCQTIHLVASVVIAPNTIW